MASLVNSKKWSIGLKSAIFLYLALFSPTGLGYRQYTVGSCAPVAEINAQRAERDRERQTTVATWRWSVTSIYNRHTATRFTQDHYSYHFKFGLLSFKLLAFKPEKVAVSDAWPGPLQEAVLKRGRLKGDYQNVVTKLWSFSHTVKIRGWMGKISHLQEDQPQVYFCRGWAARSLGEVEIAKRKHSSTL